MQTLVDSSVWIDYLRGGGHSDGLDYLIDENLVVINDLILADLVPFLRLKNQREVIDLLNAVAKLDLRIDWDQIVDYQHRFANDGFW